MLESSIDNKTLLIVFTINNKKTIYSDVNAKIFDEMFSLNSNIIHSVKFKREAFETEDMKIIFIEVGSETDLGLN